MAAPPPPAAADAPAAPPPVDGAAAAAAPVPPAADGQPPPPGDAPPVLAAAAAAPPPPEAPAKPAKPKRAPKPIKRSDSLLARERQETFSRNEVEHTIKRIASHRGIVGTLIVDKHCVPIRSSMDKANTNLNPLTMFRLRTNRTEVIITPDEKYYLIVVQKTSHMADAP